MQVGDKYRYKHNGTVCEITLVSDKDFIDKGHGEYFLKQFYKHCNDYVPAYDHKSMTFKMVSTNFLSQYGVKISE